MILLLAILFISFEAITEALIKRHCPKVSEILFKWMIQWFISLALFTLWFVIVWGFDKFYVPLWKLVTGFVFVRFAIFDVIWNLTRGVKWNYYGTTKLYDRIMFELSGWGWFMKLVLGIVGICFLLGLS